ncbi:MAG: glycosyltransferase family 2 protein [Paracoccaceae bacterium]
MSGKMFGVPNLIKVKPADEDVILPAGEALQTSFGPAKIQSEILSLVDRFGQIQKVFLERVSRQGELLVLLGWSTSPLLKLELRQNGNVWPLVLKFYRRDDVASALGVSSDQNLGFTIVTDAQIDSSPFELGVALPRCAQINTGVLLESEELTDGEFRLLPELLTKTYEDLVGKSIGEEDWWDVVDKLPECNTPPIGCYGFLEGAFASIEGGVVVFGWALHFVDSILWFEDDAKNTYPLDKAFRRERRDIIAAFSEHHSAGMDAGFIAFLPNTGPKLRLKLRIVTASGLFTLGEINTAETLSEDPLAAAEKLFDVLTEDRLLAQRSNDIDWPFLLPLIQKKQSRATLSPKTIFFGSGVQDPKVSIVIYLSGNLDAFESQLMAFSKDESFLRKTEIIFVLDDPMLRSEFLEEAELCHRLHGVAFKVVYYSHRRGASAANNAGSEYSRGDYLLFLDSSVIPLGFGWLDALFATLDGDDTAGAVGARLLSTDSSICHDGYEVWDPYNESTWYPRVRNAGLPADFGHNTEAATVAALSAGCLLVARDLFDKVGGWNTSYLPGTGADFDFSMRLRQLGHRVVLQPHAMLTQISRSSKTGMRGKAFHNKIAILNAARLNAIWGADIAALAGEQL